MEKYDYRAVMKEDILNYIKEEYGISLVVNDMTIEDAYEKMFDELWVYDGVTGNASGSYFCNAWKAEEAICHNLDIAEEAYEEFGYSGEGVPISNPEHIDCTIRCYLLGEVLAEVLDELYEDEESEDEEDEEI